MFPLHSPSYSVITGNQTSGLRGKWRQAAGNTARKLNLATRLHDLLWWAKVGMQARAVWQLFYFCRSQDEIFGVWGTLQISSLSDAGPQLLDATEMCYSQNLMWLKLTALLKVKVARNMP